MITKEQLQAILNIIPEGYTIEISTKGTQKQVLRSIYFKEYEKKALLVFTDENNMP